MENKTNSLADLQQTVTENFQQLTNSSLAAMKPLMENMMNNITSVNKSFLENPLPLFKLPQLKLDNCDCCPPKQTCPPHCIATIKRTAQEGERIVVPFIVKNTCSQTTTYRVGVRELINEDDGQAAPAQPTLNKMVVTLAPGRSERVLMTVDLANFSAGATYMAEIVLREKEINQNICFTLIIDSPGGPVVTPKSEQDYRLRWQSWKDHYYCEKPTAIRQIPGAATDVTHIAGN
ncbi:MAG: hypothetical protein ABI861_08855 [Panacibacter sp.]